MRPVLPTLAAGLGRATRSFRLVLLLTSANLVLASLAAAPLLLALDRTMAPAGSNSPFRHRWPAWFAAELPFHAAAPLDDLRLGAGGVVWLWCLLAPFLSAGALGILHDADGAFSSAAFFRACGRYGLLFLRLFGCFLIACWMLKWLFGGQVGAVVDFLEFDWPSQRDVFFLRLAFEAVYLGLFSFLVLGFEYARVRAVVDRRRSALTCVAAGFRFLLRAPKAPTLLLLGLKGAQLAVLLLAGEILARLPAASWAGIAGTFVVAQGSMGARSLFRLASLECARLCYLGSESGGEGEDLLPAVAANQTPQAVPTPP